jgi:hypothetical protein
MWGYTCHLGNVPWMFRAVSLSVSKGVNVKKLETRILTDTLCIGSILETED